MTTQLQPVDWSVVAEHRQAELTRRIERALRRLQHEPEAELLRILAQHQGAANAISIRRIRELVNMYDDRGEPWPGWTDREIKQAVKDLIELHGIPIGSSRKKPYGYFLILTAEDQADAVRPLRGEFFSLLRRLRALTSKQEVARLFGQAQLELDKETGGGKAA